jgi:hypothetical protein
VFLDFLFKKKSFAKTVSPQTRENVTREWKNIKILLSAKGPSQMRQALISADKCLDNILRDLVSGDTMGERLKSSEALFDRDLYNKIWEAHKIRNTLVHEAGYEPPYFVINEAVENFRLGLNKLGLTL